MEATKLIAAPVLNGLIVGLDFFVLSHLTDKRDLLKYYTYLSNLIAMISGAIFVVFTLMNLISGNPAPVWLKGIRFCATYMLVTTMFVFSLVLLPRRKSGNLISHNDFSAKVSPKLANLVLHYLCPVISAVSFILFERQPVLAGSEWTLYAAIPTLAYWAVYLLLTTFHLWKDPYGFSTPSEKNRSVGAAIAGVLMFLLIPALSMGLDYLLWWLNTLNL